MNNEVQNIPLHLIDASFGNDRTSFDDAALQTLADSIRENGLAQPITVRPVGARYQIIAGERRLRAHKLLQAETIRALVVPMDDTTASALMLVENSARRDLDPMDEARAYDKRMRLFDWDVKTIAAKAGVSAQVVRNRLTLLKLREDMQFLVKSGQLSLGYAQIIAEAELDNNRQLIILKRLNECPAPTPNWLRRECATLAEAQASNDMFDNVLFAAADFAGTQKKQAFEQKLPADPRKDAAPREGSTYQAMVQGQIEFWTHAADQWDRFGKSAPRDRCLAAAAALQAIVSIMPTHSNRSKKVKTEKQTLIVYSDAS